MVGALPGVASAQDMVIDIQIAPKVLILSSTGPWVTIHADIPHDAVLLYTVTVNGAQVPVAGDKADLRGNLVIKLRRSDVKAVVEPGWVPVVVEGETSDGATFIGARDYEVRGGGSCLRFRYRIWP